MIVTQIIWNLIKQECTGFFPIITIPSLKKYKPEEIKYSVPLSNEGQ